MTNLNLHTDLFYPLGGKGSGNFSHKGRPGEIGGSSSSGISVDPSKLKRSEIFELKGPGLESALNHPNKNIVVKTVLGEWNASDRISQSARKAVERLLPHTAPGGLLGHLHPLHGSGKESVILYRGGSGKGVRSFSTDKKTASFFGKVSSVTITRKTPAIDVTKAIGVSENEIILKL